MPHSIRLRGPWDYQPLVRYLPLADGRLEATMDNLPAGGALHLPADWASVLGRDFQGRVRFTRRFHRPTGLGAGSRVWLVIDDVNWQANVTLNDRVCGGAVCSQAASVPDRAGLQRCPARFDITAGLLPQNVLSIDVSWPGLDAGGLPLPRGSREGKPGGLIGLVRLEIE